MFSIIHRVFLEYLNNCSANERAEMIELLAEHLVHIIHTKDGSQVAMECIWHSTAKVRLTNLLSPFCCCYLTYFFNIKSKERGLLKV